MVELFLASALMMAAAPDGIAALRWERRVLLVAAPDDDDPALAEQRRILARWRTQATDRDLTVVEIVGDRVTGVRESAATLRARYALSESGFVVVLIGKDGGAKLRRTRPIAAASLESTIDAMPMRRGGGR